MEQKREKKCFTVFSLRVAGLLMARGHNLVEMKPDRRNPDKNVYYFSRTNELINDINEITANLRKEA